MTNDDTGDAGGPRRRPSSRRRAIANAALAASRCATIIAEGARLVDHLPGPNRALEIHGLADELIELSESMRAIADYLRAEGGQLPAARRMTFVYALRRSFMRWLRE